MGRIEGVKGGVCVAVPMHVPCRAPSLCTSQLLSPRPAPFSANHRVRGGRAGKVGWLGLHRERARVRLARGPACFRLLASVGRPRRLTVVDGPAGA